MEAFLVNVLCLITFVVGLLSCSYLLGSKMKSKRVRFWSGLFGMFGPIAFTSAIYHFNAAEPQNDVQIDVLEWFIYGLIVALGNVVVFAGLLMGFEGYDKKMREKLPPVRGILNPDRPLSELTWLRVGGPADYLFQPADPADLADFLRALDPGIAVFPMGVGSNLIVRDGGLRAVVIRLGRGFNGIETGPGTVTAGAAALDAHVARRAAEAGLDLTFLRTIPGSIGGAVRMNAGCYGSYVADHLISVRCVSRAGEIIDLPAADLHLAYRQSSLPDGWVIIAATFRADPGDPATLEARMADQLAKRDASQPTKDRSAGSTFRNPVGHSSTGRADDSHALKAWKVIDDAGMRGATIGGAQMSPMHSNFMINIGGATAADLEDLGEEVRKRVFQQSGITLEWEIMRVGERGA